MNINRNLKKTSLWVIVIVFSLYNGYNFVGNKSSTDFMYKYFWTELNKKIGIFYNNSEDVKVDVIGYTNGSNIDYSRVSGETPFESGNGTGVVVRGIYDEIGYDYVGSVVDKDEVNDIKYVEEVVNKNVDVLGNKSNIVYEGEEYKNVTYIRSVNDFKVQVLGSKEPVIVFIEASWCSYCKRMNNETLREMDVLSGIKMVRLELDKNESLRLMVGDITSFPTIKVFNKGKSVDKLMKKGVMSIFDVEQLAEDIRVNLLVLRKSNKVMG